MESMKFFFQMLRGLLQDEADIEETKVRLANRSDFNFYDAFRVFDKKEKGYINYYEFGKFLHTFGIYANENELALLFNRLDKDSDDMIEFSEFIHLLKPFSK